MSEENKIRKLRQERKLSMKEVAKEIGVPLTTYREWEYGRSPRGEHLVKLANYFRVPSEMLVGQEKIVQLTVEQRLHRIKDDVICLIAEMGRKTTDSTKLLIFVALTQIALCDDGVAFFF